MSNVSNVAISPAIKPNSTHGSVPILPANRQRMHKVSKQSPSIRWRQNQAPIFDDEFMLGEPALDVSEPGAKPEDLDEKLRNAIATTVSVVSRPNSLQSSVSSSRRTSAASIRASWIRPRQSVSADPSPLLQSTDPSSPLLDEVLSKSNYQNIVDGTHQHLGISSVDRVTNELRSKKTVHKLAEQERRNRMNTAIADLNRALRLGNDKTANSKAATVECATKYILELQQKIRDLEKQLADK